MNQNYFRKIFAVVLYKLDKGTELRYNFNFNLKMKFTFNNKNLSVKFNAKK